jgi:hypothetical protein
MVREDSAIGIVFTTMFAAGVALMSGARTYRSLNDVLLGSLLAIGPGDLLPLAAVAAIVVAALALLHKELELSSADPEYARAIGIREDRLRLALLLLLALAVVSGIHAVGVVLTSALLVTPAAAASLLTRRLFPMMLAATAVAVASSAAGLLISWRRRRRPRGVHDVCGGGGAPAGAAGKRRGLSGATSLWPSPGSSSSPSSRPAWFPRFRNRCGRSSTTTTSSSSQAWDLLAIRASPRFWFRPS